VSVVLLLLLSCTEAALDTALSGALDPALDTAAADTAGDDTAAMSTDAFESAARCGECHPVQYGEWRQSMHAYAARSPVFDRMARKAWRDTAGGLGGFCTGCHSPFGEAQGLTGATVADDRDEMALEGVSCEACHTATGPGDFIGNNQVVREPGMVEQGPFGDTVQAGHMSTRGDFMTSPELCGSCHDVFMFPGLHIEQAYTEYLDSPAAAEGTRCQDCHMSPTPGVAAARPEQPIAEDPMGDTTYDARPHASHRFIGPDYSLLDDFPYPDDLDASAAAQVEQLQQIQSLLEAAVHIASLDARVEGDDVLVDVVLESLTAGHHVPTGFTSERQLWIELEVVAGDGATLLHSGDLDGDGNLRDAHSLDVQAGLVPLDDVLVNLQSSNVSVVRPVNSVGVVGSADPGAGVFETDVIFPTDADSIDRHSLEPLEARGFSWRVASGGHPGPVEVRARLHYRNLPPYLLQALQADDYLDRLHVFTLDDQVVELP